MQVNIFVEPGPKGIFLPVLNHRLNQEILRVKIERDERHVVEQHLFRALVGGVVCRGGVEAVDLLAAKAGISSQHHVLDVCSGMGGPARWIALMIFG